LQKNLKEQSQQLRAAEARANEQAELVTKLQCELVPLRQEVATVQKDAQENSCRLQQLIYQLESLEMVSRFTLLSNSI
jgi:capsule polysaccharide export protein KpsE/RkpR